MRRCGIAVPELVEATVFAFVISVPFETWWQAGSTDDPLFSLSRITAAVLLLAFLTRLPSGVAAPPTALFYYCMYLVAAAFSLALNPGPGMTAAWTQLFTIVQLLTIAWVLSDLCLDPKTFGRIITALRLSIGAMALLQVLGVMTIVSGATGEVRVAATGMDPNTTGAILALGFVAHAWNVADSRTTSAGRLLSAALLIPVSLALAQTGSRGALIALGAGLIAFLTVRKSGASRITAYCKVALIMAVAALAVMMSTSTVMRVRASIDDKHYSQRDELWMTSLGMIADRPLLGWGPYGNYYELGQRMGEDFLDTHNSFLLVFTQSGLVGGIPYMIGFGMSLLAALRARHHAVFGIAFPLLVTITVINQSLSWHNRKLHWIVIALALSAGHAARSVPTKRGGTTSLRRFPDDDDVRGSIPQ